MKLWVACAQPLCYAVLGVSAWNSEQVVVFMLKAKMACVVDVTAIVQCHTYPGVLCCCCCGGAGDCGVRSNLEQELASRDMELNKKNLLIQQLLAARQQQQQQHQIAQQPYFDDR